MLYINGLILHGDGFFYGYDMHADTAAAHRNHGGNLLQRKEGHTLKEHSQLRMLVHQFHVHIGIFRAAGHEHGHPVDAVFPLEGGARIRPLAIGVMVPVVIFQHAEVCQLVQQLVQALVIGGVMLLCIHLVQFGV